jgi:type IV pilus assembly protein PilA
MTAEAGARSGRGGILRMSGCRTKGFTLIELLVVILILAILMAVALPLYLRAVRDSERQTCRSNMQTIAHAEVAYKIRSEAHVYTADLTSSGTLWGDGTDLQGLPACPDGGTYTVALSGTVVGPDGTGTTTIPAGGFGVQCSHAGHGGFVPGANAQ